MAVQSDWMEKDFYDVLGISRAASQKEITKAYRKLARDLHPDTHPDDDGAEDRFKEVSHAYEVLGDATKRKEYDDFKEMVANARDPRIGGGRRAGAGAGGFGFDGDTIDLDDLLGGLFGGRGDPRSTRPARGADHEAYLEMDFEDAARGITTTLTLTGGDGGARSVKVRIPAGVEDGQRIRIPGKGGAAPAGSGPPGDLYVQVAVRSHPVFARSGRNLTLTVPITYPEAALGATVTVPTLDGPAVKVRVPAGTPSGRVLRVKGCGVPGAKGAGDLLATVQVTVPTTLTDEERGLLEQLRAASSETVTGPTRLA